jgi:hypothetical protein
MARSSRFTRFRRKVRRANNRLYDRFSRARKSFRAHYQGFRRSKAYRRKYSKKALKIFGLPVGLVIAAVVGFLWYNNSKK